MPSLSAPAPIKLQNILFATDLSPAAQVVLSHTLDISRYYGATLYTVHVLAHVPFVEAPAPDPDKDIRSAHEQLATLMSLVSLKDAAHKEFIERGEVREVLSRLIQQYAIDLVVVGCGGRHGFGKLLLGSVAEDVFRHATCPVLTFGPQSARRRTNGHLQHILFATNFGRESVHALPYALSLAEENHARLTMVYVSPEPGTVLPEPELGALPKFERTDVATDSERLLRSLIPKAMQLWHEPEYLVLFGPPAEMIAGAAHDDVDLIVMGVRRPTPLTKHFGEGVAYRLACEAPCPVLSVSAWYQDR